MVNGTASFIGPSITLIWAPGGSEGTAAHFRSDGITILWAVGAAGMLRIRGGGKNAQSYGNGKTLHGSLPWFSSMPGCRNSPPPGFESALIFT